MASSSAQRIIRGVTRLPSAGPWPTDDPFLFAVHHDDSFPPGDPETLGPADRGALRGRNMGSDFSGDGGWSMYHGEVVPGFPKHPHRGFETVTIARSGLVDHSDSLGAAGRFGRGDVQWMTAGKGISHSEMFPLLNSEGRNRVEMFQIWLNLPSKCKMVEPFFTMLWADKIPKLVSGGVEVAVVSGTLPGTTPAKPPPCPPNSWAAQAGSAVSIFNIKLGPGSAWTLPASQPGLKRSIYFFVGRTVVVAGKSVSTYSKIELDSAADVQLENSESRGDVELLLLEAKPINEPVVQHGPFVMNTRQEIMQAFQDYQATEFGRWPHRSSDPVHQKDRPRFAHYPDGRDDFPTEE